MIHGLRHAYEVTNALSSKIIQDSQAQRTIFTVLRRNWLNIRYSTQLPDEDYDDRVSNVTDTRKRQKLDKQAVKQTGATDDSFKASQRMSKLFLQPTAPDSSGRDENKRLNPSAPTNLIAQQSSDLYALTIFELTNPFMELTLHTSRPFGNVNPEWIELASELMLQSGIERLQEMSGALISAEHETDETKLFTSSLKDLNVGLVTWINECLAWGSVKKPSTSSSQLNQEFQAHKFPISNEQLKSRLQTEDLISAMFNSSINIAFPDDKISSMLDTISSEDAKEHEWKQYAKLRAQYLQKLLSIPISTKADENEHFVPAVKKLCKEYPIVPFLKRLLKFVQTIWRYNMHKDVSGKPILVQIEEGGLEGLDAAEFDEFLGRCGLKMNRGEGGGMGYDGQGVEEGTVRFRWV